MAVVSAVDYLPEAEAKKSKGNYNTKFGIGTSGVVCGDRLCSEIDTPKIVVKTPAKQLPELSKSCAPNMLETDSGCSSLKITGAKITKSYYDSSVGSSTILVNAYDDGSLKINASLDDVLIFVDGEEWDDVIIGNNNVLIEFFAGTSMIEIIYSQ